MRTVDFEINVKGVNELTDEAIEDYERQSHFQVNCGANIHCNEPGVLEFELQPYFNQVCRRHGVRERHYNTRIQQRGGFIPAENIETAIPDGQKQRSRLSLRQFGIKSNLK